MVNLGLEGRPAVVIGGGEIARRKILDLLKARANVTVVAPHLCAGIVELAQQERIQTHCRNYQTEDIAAAFVVIASTDDEKLNAIVARDCMSRNVLVNVVDRPPLCTFTVPATVSRGDLTLAIATEGRCPSLSSILREELEGRYGPEYGQLVALFGELRKQMMALSWTGPRIREKLSALYRDGITPLLADGDVKLLTEFLDSHLGPAFQSAVDALQ